MFGKIPRVEVIGDEFLLKQTTSFLRRIFKYINRMSSQRKNGAILREVGVAPLDYEDIPYNKEGWVDATKFAPPRFVIVVLMTKDKEVNGWFKGGEWFSRKLKENPEVLYWKPCLESFKGGPVHDVGRM